MITRMQLQSAPCLILLSVLAACASPSHNGASDTVTRSIGALQLREALHIEPDSATVRLQYGRIVARNAVQEQDPFCVFEIETVHPDIQVVAPGQFRITAVNRSVETFAGLPLFPYVRTAWHNRRVSFGDDDGPTHIYYKTTFRLHDDRQPVSALTCMSNQNAPGNASSMRHLTLPEIRGALGAWFVLY
jgi:hypothetical protein